METASITFITGGVRSGKSSFAEKTAVKKALEIDGGLHYIATSKSADEEMEERIRNHQKDRNESGYLWNTWEQPVNIESLAFYFKKNDVILLDCLTTLLSNELFSQDTGWSDTYSKKDEVFNRIWNGIKAIEKNCHHLILVSNEVFFDPLHEETELLFTYCQLMGKLHQQIVSTAENAYLVEAAIPLLMKGAK
ncbi:hypothetical protein CIL03_17185 [Virgibacillus indicus]|uniref:Adenosylcobinamide kinase n=1 Tax=Virgibacillus indicus TaxID=2024554 RepID=A0A265N670_9BACI|nr:bifunctional adenosylcobinamide kinase/adenosylcobinamide-phosphate guanylyltransferase [Virgibacillus indicus]OZU87325.1 hypothetical protein CIL03_17185 [Virgibacillus indicus]